uniref:Uncharacterized protein n=1 Tax=Oncorhynchus mykiss TaxID=8022 RepID=A0A8K9XCD3_ONCMY
MEDRDSTSYTDVVIHETQKMGNIIPLNVYSKATKDTEVGGCTIPKVSHLRDHLLQHSRIYSS